MVRDVHRHLEVAGVRRELVVSPAARCAPAGERALLAQVGLEVLRQVVAAHKAPQALSALEALLPCVGALVPLQLVRAREALSAKEPLANEGPLAGVPAQVGSQVGRLPVHLVAARYVADVLPALVLAAPAFPLSAVWTGARHPPQSPEASAATTATPRRGAGPVSRALGGAPVRQVGGLEASAAVSHGGRCTPGCRRTQGLCWRLHQVHLWEGGGTQEASVNL